jgi:hypothetical protein
MTKVLLDDSNLSAIGNAIRAKNGSTDTYKPREMAEAITALEGKDPNCTGIHLNEEDLVFSNANCEHLFSYDKWKTVINNSGDKIVITNPSNVRYLFQGCTYKDLSGITITYDKTSELYASHVFADCYYLEKLPNVSGLLIDANQGGSTFSHCRSLRNENELIKFFSNNKFNCGWPQGNSIFNCCYSLRNINAALQTIQDSFLVKSTGTTDWDAYQYDSMFYDCKSLDEIRNIPLSINEGIPITSNKFSSTFTGCMRVKDIVFETNNGEPLVLTMKSQTIDLTSNLGYWSYSNTDWKHAIQYNSGVTEDKLVTDAASYEALKNDPDWFTTKQEYSRYNHDSAVNTINSLPDTSAYGTNTIKFKGAAGSATDGGAINTLTETEIAVAAAKGWTVTFS